MQHLQQVVDADKAMVIATTGYTADELATINELAAQIRCVMAPNGARCRSVHLFCDCDVSRSSQYCNHLRGLSQLNSEAWIITLTPRLILGAHDAASL